ncbi:ABC transporter permease [Metabacillus bambusae]|uniref:Putative hemin transport system permease protein HrtB n=1 Tax=Metabacillus bambusae TaxID=2795218 RepID=A0ABS3N631_9BACI|nr:ABC transporter permease [Metabacillus bambusae]MBO1513751.1 ABC transporter permease [Metabacillus bambusae]
MFLALREMKHAKLRYLLIGFIMILIAWLVLFVSGLAKGLASDNASSIQKMNADYFVLQEESDHRLTRSILHEQLYQDISQYIDKKDTAPLGIKMATLADDNSPKKVDATFFAIDVDGMLAPSIVEGNMIDNTSTNEVIVDHSLRDEGFIIGDQLKDQASGKDFKIVGFSEGQSFSHAPVIHINFKQWSQINHSTANNEPFFNAVAIKSDQNVADQIKKAVSGIEIINKEQVLKGIPGFKEEQGSLTMMITFLFVIAAFVLAVFFYVITIQKINQFGLLKAIGAKSNYLARNLISQILLLTIMSLLISIALTYSVAVILPSSMPFELTPKLVLGCSLLFIFVSVIGSLLSLFRVVKIDALEAIGRAA